VLSDFLQKDVDCQTEPLADYNFAVDGCETISGGSDQGKQE